MPLGDSLTSGTTIVGGYRNRLYNLLTGAGFIVDFVGTETDANNPSLPDRNHQGMGGFRIDQLQSGLSSWLNAVEDPDVVLLMIGTNDFSADFNVGTAQDRLAALVADLATKRPFAKIIVASLPLRTDNPGLEVLQSTFNASIPGMVNDQVALGRQVLFLDMHAVLQAGDLEEGVHPTLVGCGKMADAWNSAISSVITPLGTSNPPAIVRTEAPVDLQHIAVRFSKPLADSAADPANFSLTGGLAVSQAVLDPLSKRIITLTTGSQAPGTLYTLSVSGIEDRTPQQNQIAAGTSVPYSPYAHTNGSFELDFAGWTTTGNMEIKSAAPYLPAHGAKLVAFNTGQSVPNGVLTQSFPTTAGATYELLFDAGVLGVAAQQRMQVSVTGSGNLEAQTITLTGPGGDATNWQPRRLTFVADSATTTMSFQDQSIPTDSIDLLLDNVRVTTIANPGNTAPVAVADSFSTQMDTALLVPPAGVLANDTDSQSNSLTAVLDAGPIHGSAVLNSNGSFTYTPDTGYTGADSFTYHATDGALDSNVVTVNITVNASASGVLVNGSFEDGETGWTMTGNYLVYDTDAPYVAFDGGTMMVMNGGQTPPNAVVSQTFATTPGQEYVLDFNIGILAINFDEQRLGVEVTGANPLVSQTESVFGNGQGNSVWSARSYSFTANSAATTLTFRDLSPSTVNLDLLLDNVRISAVATPVNTAPVAVADSYSTSMDAALVVPAAGLLANDTDAQADVLTAVLNAGPSHGSVSLNANGGFTYTPDAGYTGGDSFTYHANDGSLDSNIVTVSITVNATTPDILVNGSFEDGETGWTMTGNYLVYDTAPPYIASDRVTMVVMNGGQTQPSAVVSQTFATVPGQSYVLDFDIGILALNASEQNLGVEVTGASSLVSQTESVFGNGQGNSVWAARSYPFTADSATTTLTFRDQSATSNGIDLLLDNVRVTATGGPVNTAPVAVEDSYSTNQGTALVVPAAGVLTNDTDAQSDPLTAILNAGPSHGSLTLNANGGFTYTPATGYSGSDSFTYHANDGSLDSNIVTVSITVNLVNTAPVAVADSFSTDQGTVLVVPAAGVLTNDTDGQSDPLTAVLNAGASHGSLTLNANGGFTYTPTTGYSGSDSFTYHANDGSLDSNIVTVSITVNVVNTAPVAVADSYSTNQGSALVVPAAGVLANDTDAQSDPLTAILNAGPSHGSLTLNANGSFTYTPATGYSGSDSFTYRANDGNLNSNIATVSITVNVVNTAPVAVADSYSTITGTALVVPEAGVLTNDTDPQSNALTAVLDAGPGHGSLTLNANGGFTYTPATGYTGPDSFTYHANDGSLNSNVTTVNIAVNDAVVSEILVNGSFESGYTGWSKSGNQAIEMVAPYPATDGIRLVAFNGRDQTPNGVLFQSFSTVAGQTYTLSFDAGVLAYIKRNQKMTVSVTGASNLVSQTIVLKSGTGGTTRWVSKRFTFVADSATTILTFQDRSNVTNGIDLLLDNVHVTGPPAIANGAPVAVADSYSVNKNTSLVVPAPGVLANDTDPQSHTQSAVLDAGPGYGSLTLNSNGGFTYTPNAGYIGSDSFTYHATDGSMNSDPVTVSIAINEVNPGILVNPSFESGFAGWTTSGNQAIGYYPATDGIRLVAFNGGNSTPNAILAQTFATTPGQTYSLTFDASVFAYTTDSQSLRVSVTGAADLLTETVTINGLAGGLGPWLPQGFSFTADSPSTTLEFRDQSSATVGLDLLLDNVRVVAGSSPAAAVRVATPAVPSLVWTPKGVIVSMAATETGSYVLERSEDLTNWEYVETFQSNGFEQIEFHDTRDPLSSELPKERMFYRFGFQPESQTD